MTSLCPGDYMSQADVPIYEDLQDFDPLKKFMEDALEDYNDTPGVISMDLVLFRDAIEHGNLARDKPLLKQAHSLSSM